MGVPAEQIRWVSPLVQDQYSEHRDRAFLERLGVEPRQRSLDSFWPARGPQWDALAVTDPGDVVLVEAKSHIRELLSGGTAATAPRSVRLIRESLEETRRFLGGSETVDCSGPFYQYTNRLAHLYFLRALNEMPAWLAFVYFVGDEEMGGPASRKEWRGAIKLLETMLGIRRHRLRPFVVELFIEVGELASQ